MVYSSLPAYLDPPNWQQQQAASEQPRVNENSHQLLHPAPQLPPPGPPHGGSGSIRPGSMAYQARLAMLPQPVAALKCPRCESTNTKFCYFNNYNLAQPRHFCKTCRRYWTQGGALRNVPVGGGCRRNKKNRSRTRPKSPAQRQVGNSGSARSSPPGTNCNSIDHEMIGNPLPPQIPPQLPFMGSLQNFTRYHGVGSSHSPNIGLNFSVHDQNINTKGEDHVVGFQIGSNSSGTGGRSVLQQNIPFLGGLLDSSTGLNYPLFQSDHQSAIHDGSSGGMNMESNSRVFQLPPIKIEENKGLNLTIPTSMDVSENNQLLWGGNSWTELTGLSSSSATNLL